MLKRTVRKIRSEHGASLSMALLLFLVCTVVASIAITAGTAASGRLSQLREATKSYYNVTSAASILAEELKNSPTINITTSCNATRNAESWIPTVRTWSVTFDDKIVLKDGEPGTELGRTNSTLFELLTCDTLYYGHDSDNVNNDLTQTRVVNEERAIQSIDFNNSNPSFIVNFKNIKYNPFSVTASPITVSTVTGEAVTKSMFDTIDVTVKCNEDNQTYSFVFTEAKTKENPLPATYTVVGSLQTSTSFVPSETHLEWYTTVTWGYLYTIAGGS